MEIVLREFGVVKVVDHVLSEVVFGLEFDGLVDNVRSKGIPA